MTYTKTNWVNGTSGGTPINATNLNHIENGIYDNSVNVDTLTNLLSIQSIDSSEITAGASGISIYSACFKFNNICFVSLAIGDVTIAAGNVTLLSMPFRPKVASTPLIANLYRNNNSQQVCFIDESGNIHINFATSVTNGEIRIVGFYEIEEE